MIHEKNVTQKEKTAAKNYERYLIIQLVLATFNEVDTVNVMELRKRKKVQFMKGS